MLRIFSRIVFAVAAIALCGTAQGQDIDDLLRQYEQKKDGESIQPFDFGERKQMYIEDSGIYYMTPREYEEYSTKKREEEARWDALEQRMDEENAVRREQAEEKLTGYAIAIALGGIVGACQTRSWIGKIFALVVSLGLAAFLISPMLQ